MKSKLSILILGILLVSGSTSLAEKQKFPFRTFYVNDVSQIVACASPWHKHGEGINDDKIRASIDEVFYGPAAGGIDVYMLQPCFTWVPWWKSEVYPANEHYRRLQKKLNFGEDVQDIGTYMIGGGDMIKPFVRRCRKLGMAPFISFRLNDHHYKEQAAILSEILKGNPEFQDFNPGPGLPGSVDCISQFFMDHPEWWIGPEPPVPPEGPLSFLHNSPYRGKLRNVRSMNWAVPEVREHVFSMIDEICTNYDIDGLELDFMRHAPFFRLDETTLAQREKIMTDFVKQVRVSLDKGAKPGQRRWLTARIPFRIERDKARSHTAIGLDLKKLVDAGVDMFNLSCHYVTEQQSDLKKIHEMIPNTPLIVEFTHVTEQIKLKKVKTTEGKQAEEFRLHRLITDEQIYTLAHLAYQRGAQGISAFNFPYSRHFGERSSAICHEPPFHVLRHLRDKAWIAKQDQHYFITKRDAAGEYRTGTYWAKSPREIKIDMVPPTGGWKKAARLRLQSPEPFDEDLKIEIHFNGKLLEATDDVSDFYPVANPDGHGDRTTLRAWNIPVTLLRDGINTITVKGSKKFILSYIDLQAK